MTGNSDPDSEFDVSGLAAQSLAPSVADIIERQDGDVVGVNVEVAATGPDADEPTETVLTVDGPHAMWVAPAMVRGIPWDDYDGLEATNIHVQIWLDDGDEEAPDADGQAAAAASDGGGQRTYVEEPEVDEPGRVREGTSQHAALDMLAQYREAYGPDEYATAKELHNDGAVESHFEEYLDAGSPLSALFRKKALVERQRADSSGGVAHEYRLPDVGKHEYERVGPFEDDPFPRTRRG